MRGTDGAERRSRDASADARSGNLLSLHTKAQAAGAGRARGLHQKNTERRESQAPARDVRRVEASGDASHQRDDLPSFLQSDMYLQRLQYHRSAIGNGPAQAIATTNITTSTSPSLSEASSFLVSRSSTLPTLLEESDGTQPEGAEGGFSCESMRRAPGFGSSSSSTSRSRVPMSLTRDALMATQRGRLEMRPLGYELRTDLLKN